VNVLLPPGGILIGIGTDVIEVARVAGVYERQGERFLHRVFTEEERAYCLGMKDPSKHLAARFAAKEAIAKAFSTGIGAELGWTSMSIHHGPRGEPLVRLDEQGRALLHQVGGTRILISLAHCDTIATAFAAIISCDDPEP
jgi:holo-[acyl-carrier protein] synthase